MLALGLATGCDQPRDPERDSDAGDSDASSADDDDDGQASSGTDGAGEVTGGTSTGPGGQTTTATTGSFTTGSFTTTSSDASGTNGPSGAGPYGSCFSGSDIQCDGSVCWDEASTCSPYCGIDDDCPWPASGSAVPRCDDFSLCVLFCSAQYTCPDGMECIQRGFDSDSAHCEWTAP